MPRQSAAPMAATLVDTASDGTGTTKVERMVVPGDGNKLDFIGQVKAVRAQYANQCGDVLCLFRMGDFYEVFFEDAEYVSKALGLTLTSRSKRDAEPMPMAGFPHHQLENYLRKLLAMGKRVAVCEQVK